MLTIIFAVAEGLVKEVNMLNGEILVSNKSKRAWPACISNPNVAISFRPNRVRHGINACGAIEGSVILKDHLFKLTDVDQGPKIFMVIILTLK